MHSFAVLIASDKTSVIMPPKKTDSIKPPAQEQSSTDVSKKGQKHSEYLDAAADGATRKPSTHPTTMAMIKEALTALDNRKGSSVQAIRGYILEKHPSVTAARLKYLLRNALTKGLETGTLMRPANSTGNGAQGRFRLANRGKTKVPKGTENSDPNVQEPGVKTKDKEKATIPSKKPKPAAKNPKDEDSGSAPAPASKVAPAKKPKTAGAKETATKSKVGTGSKTRKAKSPAKGLAAEGGDAAAKSRKRGKTTL